jgi:hypothetical protein
MSFLALLAGAKKAYDIYGEITGLFVDETERILHEIAERELMSAIRTMDDSKHSRNNKREIASAITQMRLALAKTDDLITKCQISLLVSLCYKALGEPDLAGHFSDTAIKYFTQDTDEKLDSVMAAISVAKFFANPIVSVLMMRPHIVSPTTASACVQYNLLIAHLRNIGIESIGKEVSLSEIVSMRSALDFERFRSATKHLVTQSQAQFKSAIDLILKD